MALSLESRDVGRVTIVRCNGRIVAGADCESLRAHVAWLLRDHRAIVLHLGDVVFIDSSGLGTIVRSLTSTHQVHGDLKLCNVPEHVQKVLQLSHLVNLFDSHDSEEAAVAAFYRLPVHNEAAIRKSKSILCVDRSADVLAYLRELLQHAGYDVHTSTSLRDSVILMRATHFDLLLKGTDLTAAPGIQEKFEAACAKVPVVELGSEFATSEAGAAAAGLLEQIAKRLAPGWGS